MVAKHDKERVSALSSSKQIQNEGLAPPAGFEPATIGLEVLALDPTSLVVNLTLREVGERTRCAPNPGVALAGAMDKLHAHTFPCRRRDTGRPYSRDCKRRSVKVRKRAYLYQTGSGEWSWTHALAGWAARTPGEEPGGREHPALLVPVTALGQRGTNRMASKPIILLLDVSNVSSPMNTYSSLASLK